MPTLLRVVIHEHAGAHVTYKTKRKGTRKTQRPFVACRETDKVRVWGAICSKLSEQTILLESVLDTDTCIDLQQKETRASRSRTSQYKLFHLKKEDETELVRLCSVQSEVYNKKGKKRKRKRAEGE